MPKKYDKLVWLEDHGIFITNIWLTIHGEQCVTWEAHGGYTMTGKAEDIEDMYDNLCSRIKEDLYKQCLN